MCLNKIRKQFLMGLFSFVLIFSLIACNHAKQTFTITWDIEGVTSTTIVDSGVTPSYTGVTPTKASTAEFDYTFNGWSPTIVAATANATYKAQFTSTTKNYMISWNIDGVITNTLVAYGVIPQYNGETPSKVGTDEFNYIFSGWSPALTAVTCVATYTAQFTTIANTCTVIFQNYDNTLLLSTFVPYGTIPVYNGAIPTKPSINGLDYTFNGWSPTLSSVTSATTYTAQFTSNNNGATRVNSQTLKLDISTTAIITGTEEKYDDKSGKWYSFTPSETDVYVIKSTGANPEDCDVYLFDSLVGNNIDYNENGSIFYRFRLEYELMVGITYYFFVTFYEANYGEITFELFKMKTVNELTQIINTTTGENYIKALIELIDLAYYGNGDEEAIYACENLDINKIKLLAEDANYNALQILLNLIDYFNVLDAQSVVENLNILRIVALAEGGNLGASDVLMGAADHGNLAAKNALKNLNITIIKTLAEKGNFYATFTLMWLADYYENSDALNSLNSFIIIEFNDIAITGNFDAVYIICWLAYDYGNDAAIEAIDSIIFVLKSLAETENIRIIYLLMELDLNYNILGVYEALVELDVTLIKEKIISGDLYALELLKELFLNYDNQSVITAFKELLENNNEDALSKLVSMIIYNDSDKAVAILKELAENGNFYILEWFEEVAHSSLIARDAMENFDMTVLTKLATEGDLQALKWLHDNYWYYQNSKYVAAMVNILEVFVTQAESGSIDSINAIIWLKNKNVANTIYILKNLNIDVYKNLAEDGNAEAGLLLVSMYKEFANNKALNALLNLDTTNLLAAASNGDLEAARLLIEIYRYFFFNGNVTEQILAQLDVTGFKILAETGDFVALDNLWLIEWCGSEAATNALKTLDVTIYITLAKEGDFEAVYVLECLVDNNNHEIAENTLKTLDISVYVELASGGNQQALYILYDLDYYGNAAATAYLTLIN